MDSNTEICIASNGCVLHELQFVVITIYRVFAVQHMKIRSFTMPYEYVFGALQICREIHYMENWLNCVFLFRNYEFAQKKSHRF